ncbi:MAG: hypothetical protein JEZ14_12265 [Marinilabiliaceae bacterium]|nr:hypothetical protein [Marinilabiliaceae bacterium]
MPKEKLDEIFLDVRKAYRLLYHYQKRVLDLIKFIGEELDFEYSGGLPYHMEPSPKRNQGSLDNSPWDWLNMYFYEFRMQPKKQGRKKINFSIFLQSDSGPFTTSEMQNLDSYASVEESKTRLIFAVSDNDIEYETITDDAAIGPNKNGFRKIKTEKGSMLSGIFDLSDFLDEESTRKQLDRLMKEFSKRGIELK